MRRRVRRPRAVNQCSGASFLSECEILLFHQKSSGKTRTANFDRRQPMAKMKAVQVPKAGAEFEIVEREIPQPGAGQVRIHVQACGICHSDVITKEGLFPGITYLVPASDVHARLDQVVVLSVAKEADPPRKSVQQEVTVVRKNVR